MKKHHYPGLLVLLLLTSFLTACSTTAPVQTRRFVWPSPPDEPKIEWIANYSSSRDLKETQGLFEKIIGEEDILWFEGPMGVAADGAGRVVVSLTGGGIAFLVDLNTKEVHKLGGDPLVGAFRRITGVAVDGDGNFYAADGATGKIFVVSPTNKPIKVLDVSKHVTAIVFFTIDKANKRIVIPDTKGHKIVVTDLDGNLILSFSGPGASEGKLNRPTAAAVEKDGTIVVADSFNARIQRFTSKGEFINTFGRRGDGQADFSLIKDVAVDSDDHIYVTDGGGSKLVIFDSKGQALLSIGQPQSRYLSKKAMIGGFLIPQGIAIDKNDRIYIADQKNDRVQVYQYLNKRYLEEHPIPVAPGDPVK